MPAPRVFVTRVIAQLALDRLSRDTVLEVWQDALPPPYDVIRQKALQANGLLSLLSDRIDSALMDAAPNLKIVANMAVGFDNIDVAAATKHRIIVTNTPGVLTETTADFVFALLMSAARRVVEADGYTRKGMWKTWGPQVLLGQDVHGATLGIIGMGRIGIEVARRARGFGMRVLYFDQSRRSPQDEKKLGVEYAPFEELLSSSDFISIHVPLTAETRHMIAADEFALMRPSAVFVNTSRGSVVDQRALYKALKERRIFAAALDVTEVEPIPPDDPLLTLDNVIIAPHIASASFKTRERMALMAVENLLAGLKGAVPPNCLNPEVFGLG